MVILFAAIVLLSSCSSSDPETTPKSTDSAQTDGANDGQPGNGGNDVVVENIQKADLLDLVMKDGALTPGENMQWKMSKEDFLSLMPDPAVFDMDSDKYDKARASKTPNGTISYSPVNTVEIEKYDVSAAPTYVFNPDGVLISVKYKIQFSARNLATYTVVLQDLIDDADAISQLTAETRSFGEAQDIVNFASPVTSDWNSSDGSGIVQITHLNFQGQLSATVTVTVE